MSSLTTAQVRGTFASHHWREVAVVPVAEAEQEFDAWLARHDAEILQDFADRLYHDGLAPWPAVQRALDRARELREVSA